MHLLQKIPLIITLVWIIWSDYLYYLVPIYALGALLIMILTCVTSFNCISIIYIGLVAQFLYRMRWIGSGDALLLHIISVDMPNPVAFMQILTCASTIVAVIWTSRRFPVAIAICISYFMDKRLWTL